MLRKILLGLLLFVTTCVVALVLFVSVFDWNHLKPLITSRVADSTGRKLEIRGNLDVAISFAPRIVAEDIVFQNAPWAAEPEFLTLHKLDASIRLRDLLRGHVVFPHLLLEGLNVDLERDPKGEVNWQVRGGSAAETAAKAAVPEGRRDFPAVLDFALRDARIVYRVPEKHPFETLIKEAKGRSDDHGVELHVTGQHEKRDATFDVTGGPVGSLWDEKQPYPLRAVFQTTTGPLEKPGDKFSADAEGELTKPTAKEGRVQVRLDIGGTDMAQLYPLFGIVFPKTPIYRLTGDLTHQGSEWTFENFRGRMGGSDLGGRIVIDTAPDPPRMEAKLDSSKLDITDLSGFLGHEPKKMQPEPAERKKDENKTSDVFPDKPIDVERLRAMNVNASLDATTVIATKVPIDRLHLAIALENGVLKAVPARFELGGGSVDLEAMLDSKTDPLKLELKGDVRSIPLQALMRNMKLGKNESVGVLGGRIDFNGSGNTVKKIASSLNGEGFLAMSGGQISQLLIELIGLDIWESLGLVVKGDKPVGITCAVLKTSAHDGELKADTLVFDTTNTKITGEGSANLGSEKLNVLITPYPKDFSPFTVRSPIRIAGTLTNPAVSLDTAKVGPGGKIKRVLSDALSVLVGLLPPLDEVLNEDTNCSAMIADARRAVGNTNEEAEAANGEDTGRKPDRGGDSEHRGDASTDRAR